MLILKNQLNLSTPPRSWFCNCRNCSGSKTTSIRSRRKRYKKSIGVKKSWRIDIKNWREIKNMNIKLFKELSTKAFSQILVQQTERNWSRVIFVDLEYFHLENIPRRRNHHVLFVADAYVGFFGWPILWLVPLVSSS